ncbi:MAG TPA: heavy metal-associated domain-containing protein, partial [Quisquiliibacterium sp.]|nr:heavy metal-associated domain-containing protein [Quisquiliibacterium sp.]
MDASSAREAAHGADATHLFSIPAMDCAAEESEIRAALDGIEGVRRLHFRLGDRTLGIDAPAAVIPAALDAIRRAGFEARPVGEGARRGARDQSNGRAHGHDHSNAHG